MGYRTWHNLNIEEPQITQEQLEDIVAEFRAFSEEAEYCLGEDGSGQNDSRWSGYEEELKEFSTRYPDIVFNLSGNGDDEEDKWDLYVKNGKSQFCPVEFIYPPYDESKLK